jgi:hypothetical protein
MEDRSDYLPAGLSLRRRMAGYGPMRDARPAEPLEHNMVRAGFERVYWCRNAVKQPDL